MEAEKIWELDESPDWGPELEMLTGKERFKEEELEKPYAATEMGLIYVNPEGPQGNPDPVASAKQIRVAFERMGMNDEETVALVAGGHAFGKCHGACPASHIGPDPESSPIEQQGFGWKNNYKTGKGPDTFTSVQAEYLLIDKAQLLRLTVPEMTVLIGGMRVLGANYQYSNYGVFTENPGILSNDFFINLLDMGIEWQPADENSYLFKGQDRKTGSQKWTATRVDLIFGHHNELRVVAEVYGADDSKEKFVNDFINAWNKVMNLDRFVAIK